MMLNLVKVTTFLDLCLRRLGTAFLTSSNASAQDSAKRRVGKGEYGHQPEDIERYEKMGFVMSGNRRTKKGGSGNAESPARPALMQQREEKALRETQLVARFKELAEQQKAMKDT